jgi:hypothetical protein
MEILAGLIRRFPVMHMPREITVIVFAVALSLVVGGPLGSWRFGVITFLVFIAGEKLLTALWPRLSLQLSSQDDEAEHVKITHQRLQNCVKIEIERNPSPPIDPLRTTHLDLCTQELLAVEQDLTTKQLNVAWDRLRFVEETLLSLEEKTKIIAQLETLTALTQEFPEEKRAAAMKSLEQARALFMQDSTLATHETMVRTYLKEALTAINAQRRLFHWHRSIYKCQVFYLLVFISPLLLGFFALLRQLLPLTPLTPSSGYFLGQIFILGALGGVVSLLLNERSLGESVTSFYYGKVGLWIKPVLGAVGAGIIYFLFESDLLFHVVDVVDTAVTHSQPALLLHVSDTATTDTPASVTGIVKLEVTRFYFYYALAFFSGFSERFFTATVARLEGRLSA